MPFLKMELLKNATHIFTKYQIYQIFTIEYVNKKIISLSGDSEYKKRLIAKYE
jgi:hypothetical protein